MRKIYLSITNFLILILGIFSHFDFDQKKINESLYLTSQLSDSKKTEDYLAGDLVQKNSNFSNPIESEKVQLTIPNRAEDEKHFKEIIQKANNDKIIKSSMGKIIQYVAEKLIGTSYKSNLLDQTSEETLFISLSQFDCMLFVENVLAIARNIALQNYEFSTFIKNILDQRYRNGQMTNYCSRLHYFSDWVNDNEKRGNLQNIGEIDITWIKDQSLTDLDNLPDPDILANDIIENLEASIEDFKEIMEAISSNH